MLDTLLDIPSLGDNPGPRIVYLVDPRQLLSYQALVHPEQHRQCRDPEPTEGHNPRNNEEHYNCSAYKHGAEDEEWRGGSWWEWGLRGASTDPPAVATETVLTIWWEMGWCWYSAIVERDRWSLRKVILSYSFFFSNFLGERIEWDRINLEGKRDEELIIEERNDTCERDEGFAMWRWYVWMGILDGLGGPKHEGCKPCSCYYPLLLGRS